MTPRVIVSSSLLQAPSFTLGPGRRRLLRHPGPPVPSDDLFLYPTFVQAQAAELVDALSGPGRRALRAHRARRCRSSLIVSSARGGTARSLRPLARAPTPTPSPCQVRCAAARQSTSTASSPSSRGPGRRRPPSQCLTLDTRENMRWCCCSTARPYAASLATLCCGGATSLPTTCGYTLMSWRTARRWQSTMLLLPASAPYAVPATPQRFRLLPCQPPPPRFLSHRLSWHLRGFGWRARLRSSAALPSSVEPSSSSGRRCAGSVGRWRGAVG